MLQERVVTQRVVTQERTFGTIGSGEMCKRVVLSLAQGEIDERALDAALIVLEAVKEERQRMIDKKPFIPESEKAGEWLEDMVVALTSLGRELEEEIIQDFQETLLSVKEGKTPPKERLEEARAFFGALSKRFLNQPLP